MVIPRRPRSANATFNPKYAAAVQVVAARVMASEIPLEGDLYVRVIWLHQVATEGDCDNIAKRTLDALKGIVFTDDSSIVRCFTARVDLRESPTISYTSIPVGTLGEADTELLTLIASGEPHLQYIEVGPVTRNDVVFGPIDEAP